MVKTNITVKDRIQTIIKDLPSDRSFSMDEIKDAVRRSGIASRVGIHDYVHIFLPVHIDVDGDMYKLKV